MIFKLDLIHCEYSIHFDDDIFIDLESRRRDRHLDDCIKNI